MEKLKFSKTALQAIPLPDQGKRLTVYDTEVRKLALRITHSGARTFYVVKRVGPSMAWVKLGVFPDMTVEQARTEAAKVLGEFASGANPAEARRAYRGEATFQHIFDEYLTHKRKKDGTPLAESTKEGYRLCARGPLAKITSLKLSAISHERIAQLHRKVGKTAPYMANRALALVSAVFNYARDRRLYSGENPAAGVQGYAEPARDRFAMADELPQLFDAIAESGQRDFFLLALLTGVRRANVCAMQWADVDLDRAVWRVAKTKNGTPQNVTLSPEAVAVLHARKEQATGSQFVFPGFGATGHLVEPKRAWTTILRRAHLSRLHDQLQRVGAIDAEGVQDLAEEIRTRPAKAEKVLLRKAAENGLAPEDYKLADLRIHDLRRTLGSWQAMTGASLTIIGKSLNHKSQQSTAIYARLELDPVRQSVNTATAAMLEAAGLKASAEVISPPKKGKT